MPGPHYASHRRLCKPYRDDLVLSFAATIVSGSRRPAFLRYQISPSRREIRFLKSLTRRIRIEDAFDRCRGIVRVFDSSDSLAPSSTSCC